MSTQDTLTIYGASDDLVEVEGVIEEEFTYRDGDRPVEQAWARLLSPALRRNKSRHSSTVDRGLARGGWTRAPESLGTPGQVER